MKRLWQSLSYGTVWRPICSGGHGTSSSFLWTMYEVLLVLQRGSVSRARGQVRTSRHPVANSLNRIFCNTHYDAHLQVDKDYPVALSRSYERRCHGLHHQCVRSWTEEHDRGRFHTGKGHSERETLVRLRPQAVRAGTPDCEPPDLLSILRSTFPFPSLETPPMCARQPLMGPKQHRGPW